MDDRRNVWLEAAGWTTEDEGYHYRSPAPEGRLTTFGCAITVQEARDFGAMLPGHSPDLRDEIAIAAMRALMRVYHDEAPDVISRMAYQQADAMLRARMEVVGE